MPWALAALMMDSSSWRSMKKSVPMPYTRSKTAGGVWPCADSFHNLLVMPPLISVT